MKILPKRQKILQKKTSSNYAKKPHKTIQLSLEEAQAIVEIAKSSATVCDIDYDKLESLEKMTTMCLPLKMLF